MIEKNVVEVEHNKQTDIIKNTFLEEEKKDVNDDITAACDDDDDDD